MSSLKKNFTFNTALSVLNILFPIVTFPYVSRILGPAGIGKVQFILSIAQYFVLFAALGIPLYGVREISKIRDNKDKLAVLAWEIIIINTIGGVIFTCFFFLLLSLNPKLYLDFKIYVWASTIILFSFSNIDWLYAGLEEFKTIALRSFFIKATSIILIYLFLKKETDTFYYLLISLFSILGNNIWNIIAFLRRIKYPTNTILNLRKHVRSLIIIFAANISISIYTMLDVILVGFLANDIAVGFYSAAVKLNKIAIPVVISLGTILVPQITQSFFKEDFKRFNNLISKSYSFIIVLSVPISFGLFSFAREFMLIFSGSKFEMAIFTMQLCSPLILLIGLGHLFGFQLLIPTGNDKSYLVAVTVGMVVSLSLNLLLIPRFAEKGAAIGTLVAEIIVVLISYIYVKKNLMVNFSVKQFINAVISSVVFIPLAFVLRNLQLQTFMILLIGVPVSVVLYLIIQLFVFKETFISGLLRRGFRNPSL